MNNMAPLPSPLHILRMLDRIVCSVSIYCDASASLLIVITDDTAYSIADFGTAHVWQ